MFESTGWSLVEPSNEDNNKYDNICPTVVTWTPERTAGNIVTDSASTTLDCIESSKV